MVTQDTQDFDEFDNLIDESALDDFADAQPAKKKSSIGLIVALLLVVGGVGAAVWFLFLNPSDTTTNPPIAAPVAEAPAPEAQPLPPGVTSPDQSAEAPLPDANAEQAIAPPVADAATGEDQLQLATEGAQPALPHDPLINAPQEFADETPIQEAPIDGTLAEALPPPQDADAQNLEQPPVQDVAQETVQEPVQESGADAQTGIAEQLHDDVDNTIQAELPASTTQDVTAPIAPAPEQSTEQAPEQPPVQALTETPAATVDPATAERLIQLESQLQSLTQELSGVRETAQNAAQNVPSSDNAADPELGRKLDALTHKLDELTKHVDALETRTTTLATELQNRASYESAQPKRVQQDEPAAIAPVAPKPAPAAKPAAPKPAPKAAAKASSGGGWELRGAQPGVAWLGRLGSGEMVRYAVGQNVPGLGTIQSVTQEGGRWIVETTGGTIRQ